MADYIKQYYLLGLYTDDNLDTFVVAEMLTADEEAAIKSTKMSGK